MIRGSHFCSNFGYHLDGKVTWTRFDGTVVDVYLSIYLWEHAVVQNVIWAAGLWKEREVAERGSLHCRD